MPISPHPLCCPARAAAGHRPVRPEQRRAAQRRSVRWLPGPRPDPRDQLVVQAGRLPDRLRRQVPQRLHRRGRPPVGMGPLGRAERRGLRLLRLRVRQRRRGPRPIEQLRHRRDRRADQRDGPRVRRGRRAVPDLLLAPRAALPHQRGQRHARTAAAAPRDAGPLRRRHAAVLASDPPSTSATSSTSPARSAPGGWPTPTWSSTEHRARLRALQSVDRAVESLVETLREHRGAREHGHRLHLRQRLLARGAPLHRQERPHRPGAPGAAAGPGTRHRAGHHLRPAGHAGRPAGHLRGHRRGVAVVGGRRHLRGADPAWARPAVPRHHPRADR